MLLMFRIAVQIVAFFLLLSVVVGIGSPETGPLEKIALLGLAALVVWGVVSLRRFGHR